MPDKKLKILFVSAEVSPFAKTGGLADVAGSLPKALAAMGNDTRVVMPRYKSIKAPMSYVTDFPVQMAESRETCIVRETEIQVDGSLAAGTVPVYFIDSYRYFDRDGIYCHFDDGDRFAFFCKAVLEMLPKINFQPDIIHCNDWHTGPICMMLKERYMHDSFYQNISAVYTIHNLEYQGIFSKDILRFFEVGDYVFTPDLVEFYGSFNFMKAGLVYADAISTVSEVYSKEIQTGQYGERLEGLLSRRSKDLYGIVNGISYEEFDPQKDDRIFRNYSIEDFVYKKENKHELQEELGLPVRDVPMIGLISRLSGQKGLNLILEQADNLLKHDIQFVLLGTGDPYYENEFRNIKNRYPDKVSVYVGFNAKLAQRIYAGSDMFLMPSRFEPCGLGQIISMRYGTVPIVRATGGLAETVENYDEVNGSGLGFTFKGFNSDEMLYAIERALIIYNDKPDAWAALAKRDMQQDFSWTRSAQKYMNIFKMVANRKQR